MQKPGMGILISYCIYPNYDPLNFTGFQLLLAIPFPNSAVTRRPATPKTVAILLKKAHPVSETPTLWVLRENRKRGETGGAQHPRGRSAVGSRQSAYLPWTVQCGPV